MEAQLRRYCRLNNRRLYHRATPEAVFISQHGALFPALNHLDTGVSGGISAVAARMSALYARQCTATVSCLWKRIHLRKRLITLNHNLILACFAEVGL
jgi:hypothetical protein